MAAKMITEEDVFAAADGLKAAGKEVNSSTVRKILGNKGSFTTIQDFLQQWHARNAARDAHPLPASMATQASEYAHTLWGTAREHAAQELACARLALNTQVQRCSEQLAQAKAEVWRLEMELETATESNEELARELAECRTQAAVRQASRDQAEIDLKRLGAELTIERQLRIEASEALAGERAARAQIAEQNRQLLDALKTMRGEPPVRIAP